MDLEQPAIGDDTQVGRGVSDDRSDERHASESAQHIIMMCLVGNRDEHRAIDSGSVAAQAADGDDVLDGKTRLMCFANSLGCERIGAAEWNSRILQHHPACNDLRMFSVQVCTLGRARVRASLGSS